MKDNVVVNFDNFFIVSEAKNSQVTFVLKPQLKIVSSVKRKHQYLTCHSINGKVNKLYLFTLLEITFIVT